MNDQPEHIEIRQSGLDHDGRVFERREFNNPILANDWADSWGFPPQFVDGRA